MAVGAPVWRDWLEETDLGRRAAFGARIPQGFGSGQQDFLGGLFQPTFARYLGALGRQIQGGQAPTLSFNQYLTENFNPQRELLRAPAGTTGPQLTRPLRFFFPGS